MSSVAYDAPRNKQFRQTIFIIPLLLKFLLDPADRLPVSVGLALLEMRTVLSLCVPTPRG